MKGKKSDWVIAGFFLAFIYGFALLNLFGEDRTFSPMENRMLAQKPEISMEKVASGKYMKDFELYLTDQFTGRDSWIQVKSFAERILGKKLNHGVYYGKKGYLGEQLVNLDEEQLKKNISAVSEFSEKTDRKIYFSLIPGSVEMNRDKMPPFLPDISQKEVISELYSQLKGTSVSCVDMYDMLWRHRGEDLYYRTDHHWTSLGAYYGYAAFMKEKGEEPVPLSAYRKTVRTGDFYGTLYSRTGAFWLKPDEIWTYVEQKDAVVERYETGEPEESGLYVEEKLLEKDKYSMFLGGNQPLAVIKTGKENLPKILVLRDSYMDSMAPFLMEHYSEIYLIDFRYNRADVVNFMEEHHIDEVFICYSLANFNKDKNIGFML